MVTIDQIVEYLQRRTAEGRLSGDSAGLRRVQTAAGVLMEAASYAGDKETALRLRVLAAKAADAREQVGEE